MPKPANPEYLSSQETADLPESVRLMLVNLIYWLIESIANIDISQEAQDNLQALDEPHYELRVKKQLLKQLIELTREKLSEPGNIYGVAPMSTKDKILRTDAVNPGFIKVAQKYEVPLVP